MVRNVTFNNGNIQYPEDFILLKINISWMKISIKISVGRIFRETHQTDSKIHKGDNMGKKREMFLEKNNSGAVPGVSRMLGSLECGTVWCWHRKQNSTGLREARVTYVQEASARWRWQSSQGRVPFLFSYRVGSVQWLCVSRGGHTQERSWVLR